MAKKGREARITRAIAKIRGEPLSLALRKRAATRPSASDGASASKRSAWRKRKDKAKTRAEARGTATAPLGYHGGMKILCVGDGNMSFALALATLFGNDAPGLVVTTDASERGAKKMYGTMEDTVEALEASGASVVYGMECETLGTKSGSATLRGRAGGSNFDRVVFNFPDAGVGKVGMLSVRAQRELIASFFENAPKLLKSNGELRLTMQTGAPYDKWNVEGLALKARLVFKTSVEFLASEFPGYEYCDTPAEDAEDVEPSADDLGRCVTYVFAANVEQ